MKIMPAKPVIGDEYRLIAEDDVMTYRGKDYHYVHLCYEEKETGERFTTTDLDEVNIAQVYNQYRAEHGIPFTDEICALRKFYDLPLTTMSKILGFGNNQYGLYECGEVPSVSNGKLLKTVILSPEAFGKLAEDLCDELKIGESQLSPKVKNKILSRIHEAKADHQSQWLKARVFGGHRRDKYNGFAPQSLKMVHDCILYFVNKMGAAYKTQMNKLLFYTDFISYRTYGMGVTGLSYLAIKYGPAPYNWDKVYSAFDDIHAELVEFFGGNVGEKITADAVCDESVFTQEQLSILNRVCSAFRTMSARQISAQSHTEQAWMDNVDTHSPIDYSYAFYLKEYPKESK